MNEPDNFLSRWSRRKRAVAAGSETRDKAAATDVSDRKDAPEPEDVPVDAPQPPAEAREPLVDLTKLPSIDSITAQTDISEFLVPGVPDELKAAALRRAWVVDPRIRDFVGLADYDWDFHKPGAIPGFGPLPMNEDLRRELARIAGDLMSEPEPAQAAVADSSGNAEPPTHVAATAGEVAAKTDQSAPLVGQRPASASPDGQANERDGKDIAAAQQDHPQSASLQASASRSHGRALPK